MCVKPNDTSALHLNLIHAKYCQKSFHNVDKIYGVTVKSKTLIFVA